MTDTPNYERPNTVAGLVAKHAELSKLREQYKDEIKKLTLDMAHVKAAIKVFDPDGGTYAMRGHVIKHRAAKGSVKRFLLNALREAQNPLTSRQITELWAAKRGIVLDDAIYTELRKQIGGCIQSCIKMGQIEDVGWTEDHDVNGPYKLWQLKRGDQ